MAAVLGDIGGTNARFAVLAEGVVGPVTRLLVADYPAPEMALGAFLRDSRVVADRAVLAVAGPVANGRAELTNAGWRFDTGRIGEACGLERIQLINDFAAIALSVPELGPGDSFSVGSGDGAAWGDGTIAVLGPGTGLGVAALLADRETVVSGEGGHVTLPATDEREAAVIAALRARFGHVSAERALSGPGLMNLYATLAEVERWDAPGPASPEALVDAARRNDERARVTLDLFLGFLGGVAGDVALILGARGGVFLAGGILPGLAGLLAASPFRAKFETKGRFRDYMRAIPTSVITHPDPAFLGLARLAEKSG